MKRYLVITVVLCVLACVAVSGAGCGAGERAPTAIPPPAHGPGDSRLRPVDGMSMVYVPGGAFKMGGPGIERSRAHGGARWVLDRWDRGDERPLSPCVEAGACQAPTACSWGEPTYEDASKADHPVLCVPWQAARGYCAWAGGRLPTEAEWEYAARGPDSAIYPWGDDL